ncbi:MAG TPA: hypothetical protein VMC61_05495 [Methanocella sp.]|nr:hypothetical protein [Methanocella sp.]
MSDDDVKSLADTLMTNLVKYPDDIEVLTGSVKALEALPFMPKAKNEFIITLLLSLLKAPVNKKDALQRKTLKSEVVKFLVFFVVEDDSYARLMMTELISALDDTHGSISSSVFHTLQRLATEKPEYFEHHSAALIKQLGSINKVTRAESAKLIGIIARTHPEYVCKAMPFLQSLASFYPDAHVKRNANEAYQIIWRSRKKEIQAPVAARKDDDDGKGFADIVKLNAGTPSSSMSEVQFTDDELKEIIELTRKEFKSDAEAILNSLGVGHLTVKGKESRKKATQPKAVSPEPASVAPQAKPKKEEKTFVAPQSGIASAIKREAKEIEVPKAAPRPKAASPEPVKPKKAAPPEKPPEPRKEEKAFVTPQPGVVDVIMKEVNEPEVPKQPVKPRGDPKAGRTFKCPKCGKHVWAEGQLCNSCGAEEFDTMRHKGHYDISS